MADNLIEAPNMTATEITNAPQTALPMHGIIGDMIDRELSLLSGLVIPHRRLTPAECLKLWAKRD